MPAIWIFQQQTIGQHCPAASPKVRLAAHIVSKWQGRENAASLLGPEAKQVLVTTSAGHEVLQCSLMCCIAVATRHDT